MWASVNPVFGVNRPPIVGLLEFFVEEMAMTHRLFTILSLLLLTAGIFGCDAGSGKKESEEPVVQELEIETGEAFDPATKKDGE